MFLSIFKSHKIVLLEVPTWFGATQSDSEKRSQNSLQSEKIKCVYISSTIFRNLVQRESSFLESTFKNIFI